MTTPKLLIPLDSYRKICAYVDLCEGEVTWWFDVDYSEDKNAFVVGEIYLLKQEATAADVEMDEDTIAIFLEQMIEMGVTQMPRGWGHSHANMAAFFSGTDEETIGNLLNDTFILALVVNKKREMKATAKILSPYFKFRISDLPIEIQIEYDNIPEELVQEVIDKVTEKKYSAPTIWTSEGKGKFTKTNKKFPMAQLSSNKEKALQKIIDLNLIREWDNETSQMVYTDKKNGIVYLDKAKIITYADWLDIAEGIEPNEDTNIYGARRCINCHYFEYAHSSSYCTIEEYPGKGDKIN